MESQRRLGDATNTVTGTEIVQDGLTPEATVEALYKSLLRRPPDEEGLRHYIKALRNHGLGAVLTSFLTSEEFRAQTQDITPAIFQLNTSRAMKVDVAVSPEALSRCWTHMSDSWSAMGETEAFWSVLTDPRFHSSAQPTPQVMSEFYDGGLFDANLLEAYVSRAHLALNDFPVIAEYGCGVGRVTRWLAARFQQVVAFDISRPHLERADVFLREQSISNVELVHIRDRGDLSRLRDIDLFFSMLVLQHNPPTIILDILKQAFQGLRPGGVAFFQVPTYATDYTFETNSYLERAATEKGMEMHFVPQKNILELADQCRMKVLEIRSDHCVGNFHRWLSHTFLMLKTG